LEQVVQQDQEIVQEEHLEQIQFFQQSLQQVVEAEGLIILINQE
jgi:hypothetical protein